MRVAVVLLGLAAVAAAQPPAPDPEKVKAYERAGRAVDAASARNDLPALVTAFERYAAAAKEAFGEDDPRYARALSLLGSTYQDADDVAAGPPPPPFEWAGFVLSGDWR